MYARHNLVFFQKICEDHSSLALSLLNLISFSWDGCLRHNLFLYCTSTSWLFLRLRLFQYGVYTCSVSLFSRTNKILLFTWRTKTNMCSTWNFCCYFIFNSL